ncbi:MAG: hypothetical protein J7K94_05140 [Dehalococcoidia bacterium]|nr:hypothetical protein [Dehalococcoidia bacterium]
MTTHAGDVHAIQHLKRAIAGGKHWYIALLEAIGLWESSEEDYNGRHYLYLIDHEALDWLVLAERLCEEVDELIPESERIALLFFDRPPVELNREKFRDLIGSSKYKAYLNYLYGVLVEQFLVLAVTEEMRKERRASGLSDDTGVSDNAYRHIYGSTQAALLEKFRKERHYPSSRSTGMSELSEFTYWLFKYRVSKCDKSRVASDTKKALIKMHHDLRLRGLTPLL